jgi:predicted lipid-binding transport protein (Tim44 family)
VSRLQRVRPTHALAALAILALVLAAPAWARVGGGQSYSTGSHSSGGGGHSYGGGSSYRSDGGSGGDGELVWALMRLTFAYPEVMLPLWAIALAFLLLSNKGGSVQAPTTVRWGHDVPVPPPARHEADLQVVAAGDKGFSRTVLEEMVQLVVVRAHQRLPDADRAAMAPWVAPSVFASFGAAEMGETVFGGLTFVRASADAQQQRLIAEVRLARVENGTAWHVREHWTFVRPSGRASPTPEAVRRLGCPACGAASVVDRSGRCGSCGTATGAGQAGWQAVERRVTETTALDADVLDAAAFASGGAGTEPGYRAETVSDPQLASATRAWLGRHPDDVRTRLRERVGAVFLALQHAWSEDAWLGARPYLTDTAWHSLRMQLDQQRAAGLRNRVSAPTLERMTVTRITVDAWYEAVTVRLWANAIDWTERADGQFVGGSASEPRYFSEYWTFVRAVGAKAPKGDDVHCPSCGAPLDNVNAAGTCGHCDTVITRGDHDWVLSRIEQAEGYTG